MMPGVATVAAAEWQWSVVVESMKSPAPDTDGQNDHPRAFLWIPPNCERVRAVVVAQHNMLEEGILEHAGFRQELARLGIATIWISPPSIPTFDFNKGAGEQFEDMMQLLARESGYGELEFAPVIFLGHSAAASGPWNFAAWNPGRTLAAISVKGDAPRQPQSGGAGPNPEWGDRNIDRVPGLLIVSEQELMADRGNVRYQRALDYRNAHPGTPLAFFADAGNSHFINSEPMMAFLALFVRKAAEQRLPANAPLDGPVTLRPIDPKQGWLADRWRRDEPPHSPAAAFEKYTGNAAEAFWCFDEEMARAEEACYATTRGKKLQYVGFAQDGETLPFIGGLDGVHPHFAPADDGITFKLSGVFLDGPPVVANRGATPAADRASVGHAQGVVVISRVTGPMAQIGLDTWQVRFNRMGLHNPKRTGAIWFVASNPGDANYKGVVQQAKIDLPFRHTEGVEQHLTFPEIANQKAGVKTLALAATSDAKVPVSYFVREGPAEVEGDTLRFTIVPSRAKFPVRVTVVAWQYGRSIEPKLKSAEPVEHTFLITR
jgi:hypothetical protein